mgnify:FL=1
MRRAAARLLAAGLALILAASGATCRGTLISHAKPVKPLRGGSSSDADLHAREAEAAGGWLDVKVAGDDWGRGYEIPLTVAGILVDSPCWSGPEGVPGEEFEAAPRPVLIRYYDLANGGIDNLVKARPGAPELSGLWQLTVGINGREWTFCAHRGIWSFPDDGSPFGEPMAVHQQGLSNASSTELRSLMQEVTEHYQPAAFDVFGHTSIEFAQEVALALTGRDVPRQVVVPVVEVHGMAEGFTRSEITQHNRTANVVHFPTALRGEGSKRLADIFRNWGRRPPSHMRLGPSGEELGPHLPGPANNYFEPPPGRLVAGPHAEPWLLAAAEAGF